VSKTRHIQKRMNQRGISEEILHIVESFGVEDGDKVYLNRKACDSVEKELSKMLDRVRKAKARGGIVLVQAEGSWITAYALDSYKRCSAANQSIY